MKAYFTSGDLGPLISMYDANEASAKHLAEAYKEHLNEAKNFLAPWNMMRA